jgi:hypothetical protein
MTKSNGKGKPAGKRGVKDLAPRNERAVRAGWSVPVAPANPQPKSKATFNDFTFVHSVDKSSPSLQ